MNQDVEAWISNIQNKRESNRECKYIREVSYSTLVEGEIGFGQVKEDTHIRDRQKNKEDRFTVNIQVFRFSFCFIFVRLRRERKNLLKFTYLMSPTPTY